jgi:heme o synthase
MSTAFAERRSQALRDVVELTKPGITSLVLCTTTGGMYLAPGHVDRLRALIVVLTTAAVVSAANALNQYLERDIDGYMERTRNRPLPARRLDARLALLFGIGLAFIAAPLLTYSGGWLTGGLALLALAAYVFVYTPMKQWSPMALFVGAVPGAIPPLIGWTTASGRLDAGGLSLFAILFTWQIPHFLAIALYREPEYARAGFKVFPTVHGTSATRISMTVWAMALLGATMAPYFLHVAGVAYLAIAATLGAGFALATVVWPPRRVFFLSILHLTLVFVALVALH